MLRDHWNIQTPFGVITVRIVESAPAPAADDITTHSMAQTLCYGIDTGDPEITRAILEVFTEQRQWQMPLGSRELSDEHVDALRPELRRFVEQQAARGKLELNQVHSAACAKPEPLETKSVLPPPKEEEESFIEIELVDEIDKPVPGEPYEVIDAHGRKYSGRLDTNGFAHVEPVVGPCRVGFPRLDGEAWSHHVFNDVRAGSRAKPQPVEESVRSAPVQEEESFIEIDLVDETDQPVPGEGYEVIDATGREYSGKLDSNGFAHVAPVVGPCRVGFPRLDGEAWSLAQ